VPEEGARVSKVVCMVCGYASATWVRRGMRRVGTRTDVRGNTAEDNLCFARGFDGGAKLGVVPGVDFALALDERGVGIHLDDLRRDLSVGTRVCRGGHNDGQIKELADGGVGNDVLPEEGRVKVSRDGVETFLEVQYDQNLGSVSLRPSPEVSLSLTELFLSSRSQGTP